MVERKKTEKEWWIQMAMERVEEIRRQIGRMNLMACGARDFSGIDDGNECRLNFKVTIKRNVSNWISISLNSLDLYDVELVKMSRDYRRVVEKRVDGVYCDMLGDVVYKMCNN